MAETHPEKRLIGYARGSTVGQTQLRAAGCSSRNIYREKVTGARADRRELLRMLDRLAPGDVATVTRIDRLARSTFDLFGVVKQIVDAKTQFRSLAVGRYRYRHQHRAFDAGGVGRAGRRGARPYPHSYRRRPKPRQGPRKANGPTSLLPTPAQQKEAIRRRAQGTTLQELAHSYNVGISTIRRATRAPPTGGVSEEG